MNSKSFLHSKILLIILLELFVCGTILGQIENSDNDMSFLKKQLQMYNDRKDMSACISTMLKILKIDSTDIITKKQLKLLCKNFFDEIALKNELLDSCLYFFKDTCELPLVNLLVYYLNHNNTYLFYAYLEKFLYCGSDVSKKHLKTLLNLNSGLAPEIQQDFFYAINQRSDSLIKIYSVYLIYQIFNSPTIKISEICKSVGISQKSVKKFFVTQGDSVLMFLNVNNLNFNIRTFNNFISLLDQEDESKDVFESIKKLKEEFFSSYSANNNNYLEKFIFEYSNNNLPWKFSIVDIKRFMSIPRNSYFLNVIGIISEQYIFIRNNNLKYEVGKIFFENGLIEESKKIFVEIDFNLESIKDNTDLIPLIFSSYILNRDSIFKYFSKEFLSKATKEHFSKLREEINWWKRNNIELDLFEKVLILFSDEINQINTSSVKSKDSLEKNNSIYELGKSLFKDGLIEESKIILNKIDFNIKNNIDTLNLIPLIFSSYLLSKDSLFKKLSREFLLRADKFHINKIREELNWWKKYNIKIDFLEKALVLLSEDIPETNTFTFKPKNTSSNPNNNYYALIIAIQDYEDDIYDLNYPVSDALELRNILLENYSFDEKRIITLLNPKRSEIIKAFTSLKNNLSKEDNLLVFYAGHGNWDELAEQGYWLPADAKPNDLSEVITNTEITAYLKSIKSKHTLLISDACFSGSIFKTRDAFIAESFDINYYQSRNARKAITSGALTPVPDKSIFIHYLLKSLRDNNKKYLTSEELFLSFREAVINNSPLNQRPLFGNINDAGDEGGDFIFIRK